MFTSTSVSRQSLKKYNINASFITQDWTTRQWNVIIKNAFIYLFITFIFNFDCVNHYEAMHIINVSCYDQAAGMRNLDSHTRGRVV